MNLLVVKINSFVNNETKERIESEVEKGLRRGFFVHDEMLSLNVVDFDDVKVEYNGQNN